MKLLSLVFLIFGTIICESYSQLSPGQQPIECTRPHEHYECGSACQTECAYLGEYCPINNIRCNDACYCDKGYARDGEGGICIPTSRCLPKSSYNRDPSRGELEGIVTLPILQRG